MQCAYVSYWKCRASRALFTDQLNGMQKWVAPGRVWGAESRELRAASCELRFAICESRFASRESRFARHKLARFGTCWPLRLRCVSFPAAAVACARQWRRVNELCFQKSSAGKSRRASGGARGRRRPTAEPRPPQAPPTTTPPTRATTTASRGLRRYCFGCALNRLSRSRPFASMVIVAPRH